MLMIEKFLPAADPNDPHATRYFTERESSSVPVQRTAEADAASAVDAYPTEGVAPIASASEDTRQLTPVEPPIEQAAADAAARIVEPATEIMEPVTKVMEPAAPAAAIPQPERHEAKVATVDEILRDPHIVHRLAVWDQGYKTSEYDSGEEIPGMSHDGMGVIIKAGSPADQLALVKTTQVSNINAKLLGKPIGGSQSVQLPRDEAYVVELVDDEPGHYRHYALVSSNTLQGSRANFGYFMDVPADETAVTEAFAKNPHTMMDVLAGHFGLDRSNREKVWAHDAARREADLRDINLRWHELPYKLPEDVKIMNQDSGVIQLSASELGFQRERRSPQPTAPTAPGPQPGHPAGPQQAVPYSEFMKGK